MKNEIKLEIDKSTLFGKFNAILFFQDEYDRFQSIYNEFVKQFNPEDVKVSMFDLESFKMVESGVFHPINNYNLILRVILCKDKEDVILEYYRGNILIEHIFQNDFEDTSGWTLLKQKLEETDNVNLVLGYELSLEIDSIEQSVQATIEDRSLHPILVAKKYGKDFTFSEFSAFSDTVSEEKLKIIHGYLQKIVPYSG